jgi:hypothetical protein
MVADERIGGPCLGCDGRVVAARDPHVMMAGKRDGSVLAMFDAAPMLMLASDPDQLSQPGLGLPGVAHRGCADLARQRLEARQVKLPDDLPQLVADEGAGDVKLLLGSLVLGREQTLLPSAQPLLALGR